MLIIEHRVNWIDKGPIRLVEVPAAHGVEIDVRHDPATDRLYLHHDPQTAEGLKSCVYLDDYLKVFAKQKNAFVIFNVKEAGIEKRCADLAAENGISPDQYFLLDVEFPFLYAATRGTRKDGWRTTSIAVRQSEAEPIEMSLAQKGFVDWIWIDVNTCLPLDADIVAKMEGFKTCLVGPDRWGRPDDTIPYLKKVRELGLPLTAIMVGKEFVHLCEGS
jgi:hypothetical protein